MSFVLIITILCAVTYSFFIACLLCGWKRISPFAYDKKNSARLSSGAVSVVVACRNEAKRLPILLACLKKQSVKDFELLLVNDHSTDNTWEVMQAATLEIPRTRLINAKSPGKKKALQEGIEAASGAFILCTDADCQPGEHWIACVENFQIHEDCDLIIGGIKALSDGRLFSRLEEVEFLSLLTAGAGAAGIGQAILCNGANLAFKKEAWLRNRRKLHPEFRSGDDIFLLQSIAAEGGRIRYLKAPEALVATPLTGRVSAFIRQRIRWASKSPAYRNPALIASACIVTASAILQVCLFIGSFFESAYAFLFAAFFLLKYLLDTALLHQSRHFFGLKKLYIPAFLLSLCYPFYIVAAAATALLFKTEKWK